MKLSLLLSAASRIAYVVGEIADHPVEQYVRDGKLRDLERVILERNLDNRIPTTVRRAAFKLRHFSFYWALLW